jgi:hypothetical protein
VPSKSPQERSIISSIAAHGLHASKNSKILSQPARDASPGADAYWEAEVDPESLLDPAERPAALATPRRPTSYRSR